MNLVAQIHALSPAATRLESLARSRLQRLEFRWSRAYVVAWHCNFDITEWVQMWSRSDGPIFNFGKWNLSRHKNKLQKMLAFQRTRATRDPFVMNFPPSTFFLALPL